MIPEPDGLTLGPGSSELIEAFDFDPFALLEQVKATGKAGEVTERSFGVGGDNAPRLRTVLLVGVGAGLPADLRRAGAAVARRSKDHRTLATSVSAVADELGLRSFVVGLVLGSFGFHRRSSGARFEPVKRVVIASASVTDADRLGVDRALATAQAGWLSRSLALTPSNEKNPAWMVDRAREVAESVGLDIEVWDEHQLAEQGFGGIVGVGQASRTPPRLIRLDYSPRADAPPAEPVGGEASAPRIVLVGKGVTFDTGGLSLKPSAAMMNMKRDMTGSGVVLAVLSALGRIGCRVHVTGLLPCAENAVDGSALRPGDVIRHYGGRTSEVTNTDAEGRLVLADAIAYAVEHLQPAAVVDVATLTGAVKVALGQSMGGLFCNDDALAGLLEDAARGAGEPLWRMPLAGDYEDRLDSSVADADNAGGGPGAITAALFIQHFTAGVPWAHLDVASVGDSPVDAHEYTMGATGFGARALLAWLELADPLAGVRRLPSGTPG